MALAPSIFERCDDSNGTVIGVFHDACRAIGDVALAVKPDAAALVDQAFDALVANDYGQFDGLIGVLTTALGQPGLEHLKQRMIDLSNRPVVSAAFEVATGKVVATHKNRRQCIEFLDFMNQIVATYSTDTEFHVVLDNLNTHKPRNDRWLKRPVTD